MKFKKGSKFRALGALAKISTLLKIYVRELIIYLFR